MINAVLGARMDNRLVLGGVHTAARLDLGDDDTRRKSEPG
jgi:hypothetical protein